MTDMKLTNPKDAVGSDKLPVHLWPMSATAFGCIGLLNGMLKYGRVNWREAGIRPSIYVDAIVRHVTDWFEGEDFDPQDGVHNLSGALASLAILVDALVTDQLNDDRNYNGKGWRIARTEMEPHVARLKQLHALQAPKHWTIRDNSGLVLPSGTGPSPALTDRDSAESTPAVGQRPFSPPYCDALDEETDRFSQEVKRWRCDLNPGHNGVHQTNFRAGGIHWWQPDRIKPDVSPVSLKIYTTQPEV